MGCLPTKTSVELRGGAGEAATLPAATAVSAGVMTAEHVKMLDKLYALHRTGGNGAAAAGQTVVIEREPEPVDLTPLREEMALRLADVLSQIQGDVSRQIAAVREEAKQLVGAIKVEPPPAPAPVPAVSYDPAPLRSEFHAEIARVRKDFSQAVEKAYSDLARRIAEQPSGQPAIDPEQVESVIAERMDKAVAEAVRRIEERAQPRTQMVEVEPGAIDESEPLPHFLDDWRQHGRREEPEPETPEQRRERAIRAIEQAAEERRGAVTSPYPGKRDYYLRKAQIAFKQKMAPAQAYTDMLSTEAKRKGLTVDQLCDRIIARHYEAEAALQQIHDAEAEGTAAVVRASPDAIVDAERAAIARIEAIGGDDA